MAERPFAELAPRYRERGLWPRPIALGSKACPIKAWQKPDSDLQVGELRRWAETHAHYGIGLLMGTPLPDGTRLAALDIDRDEHVRVTEFLLGGAASGRVGKKGAAYFVRLRGNPKNATLKTPGGVHVADLLFSKKLCVIPPTIHPDTKAPYRWIGTPLHEIDFNDLPLIEA